MRTVAVIGAGVGGMAAAYDLAKGGAEVVIFEQEDSVGGLAAGFKEEGWVWSLEKYYHHWFQSDKEIRSLLTELGLEQKSAFLSAKDSRLSQRKFLSFGFTHCSSSFSCAFTY